MALSVTQAVGRLVPSVEAQGNLIRSTWDRASRWPGGKRLFSRLVGRVAPYTGTIGAEVLELRHSYARVQLRDRGHVRNHLRCVHAVALVNLAELTGNVALAYSLPDDARFIVAGLSIDYLKKARGTITGVCEQEMNFSSARAEHDIAVTMRDESGDVVARATLRTLVGPKKTS